MDIRRLRLQEWVAGALGVVLLGSTFLDWYGSGRAGRNAWEAFGALDVMLSVVGLIAVALAVVTVVHGTQAVPVAIGSLLVLVGLVASVWVTIRAASPPDGLGRDAGAWIGLGACLGVTISALASIRDQRFPRPVREAASVEAPIHPAPPRDGAGQAGG